MNFPRSQVYAEYLIEGGCNYCRLVIIGASRDHRWKTEETKTLLRRFPGLAHMYDRTDVAFMYKVKNEEMQSNIMPRHIFVMNVRENSAAPIDHDLLTSSLLALRKELNNLPDVSGISFCPIHFAGLDDSYPYSRLCGTIINYCSKWLFNPECLTIRTLWLCKEKKVVLSKEQEDLRKALSNKPKVMLLKPRRGLELNLE